MRRFEVGLRSNHETPWLNHERNIEIWEREFRNTSLALHLKRMYEERPANSRVPVKAYMGRRVDFAINQRSERDGLGCVVAVYRMGLDEQASPGRQIVSQVEARRILGEHDPSAASGGMASMSVFDARIIGIANPMALGEFKNSLSQSDQTELDNKPLGSILPKALERKHFIMTTGPMGSYHGREGGISHAVYIYGLRYEGNDSYKFMIKDPLGDTGEWDYRNTIRDFWKFNYVVAPSGDIIRNSRMQTGLTFAYENTSPQRQSTSVLETSGKKRFIAGKIERVETKKTFRVAPSQPQRDKIIFRRKKSDEETDPRPSDARSRGR